MRCFEKCFLQKRIPYTHKCISTRNRILKGIMGIDGSRLLDRLKLNLFQRDRRKPYKHVYWCFPFFLAETLGLASAEKNTKILLFITPLDSVENALLVEFRDNCPVNRLQSEGSS